MVVVCIPNDPGANVTPRFLREDGDDDGKASTWEDKVAQKYYDSLFREYAVCDLKHYKSGNVRFQSFYIPISENEYV